MTGNSYTQLIGYFSKTSKRKNTIIFIAKYFPVLNVIVYAGASIYLCICDRSLLVKFLTVPATTFLAVTIFRALVNAPRPYDELDYTPMVCVTHGKGKSFPSRHTASAVIIAIACLWLNIWFGAVMLAVALLIGASRVIVGVHYPKDVIAGSVIAVIFGGLFLV